MTKRNRRRKLGEQLAKKRSLKMENLEARRLLASDIIFGPGTVEPRNRVPADVRIDEIEQESDPRDRRITNNTLLTAEPVALGFGAEQFDAIDIRGELIEPSTVGTSQSSEIAQPNAVPPIPAIEDGSILQANPVNFQGGSPIAFTGTIGDSPSGFNQAAANNAQGVPLYGGDGDYYEFEDVEAGQSIFGHIATNSNLALILYNEAGEILQTSNEINPNTTVDNDAFVAFTIPEFGNYYFAVVPYVGLSQDFITPLNPFDPSTVRGGAGGDYTLTVGIDAVDVDYYRVDLNPGDILGVNGIGASNLLSVVTPDQTLMVRSGQASPFPMPPSSPLRAQVSTSSLHYVADTAGTHYIAVEGFQWSRYVLETRLFRPEIESAPEGQRQILFLDFDGAQINPAVFGSQSEIRELSPMRDFLSGWDIRDESALIDEIIRVVKKDFNEDLKKINPNAGVTVLNSRDHADPFGKPYVSRVIVGGTVSQATINTIGLAESIDVGNFDMEETAFVLLDGLSAGLNDPNSINTILVAPNASKIDSVAAVVGSVISHEAAHLFGAYHTDPSNDVHSLIDGGVEALLSGAGDDRIHGTFDDIDLSFTNDEFSQEEGFVGIQNVPGMLANVLVAGLGADANRAVSFTGSAFNDTNANGVQDAGEGGAAGIRVYVDVNGDQEFGIGEPFADTSASGTFTIPDVLLTASAELRVATAAGQELTAPASGGFAISNTGRLAEPVSFGIRTLTGAEGGIDFGDAPLSYGVASHEIQEGIRLGAAIDGEAATTENDGFDDDGVSLSSFVPGGTASVTISATTSGFSPASVNGWVDFNQDGQFSSSERVVSDVQVEGSETVTFSVPADAAAGTTWARFRFGYVRGIGPAGSAGVGEVEDYEVTVSGSDGGGGGTGPDAVNDAVIVEQDDSEVALDVLSNDSPGSAAISITSVSSTSQGGSVTVTDDGSGLVYSPAAGFSGIETFTYTISNAFGSDSATVSVDVNETTTDPGDPLVRFRIETADAEGNPISTIASGSDFVLNVYSDDLRDGGAGVYAGYLDVVFEQTLAMPSGAVTFGEDYPAGQTPTDGVTGDVAGELDEYGAFAGFTSEIGDEERLLFSVPMTALGTGVVTFTGNQSDILPRNEVLLLDLDQPIPASRIEFGSAALTIDGAGAVTANALTNPANRFDVNADDVVSARDALILINSINQNGARSLASSLASITDGFFLDVNQDLSLSAIDVLQVINFINDGSGEPVDALAVDLAFDADRDDNDEFFAEL